MQGTKLVRKVKSIIYQLHYNFHNILWQPDLEKVANCPQAENLELYNVLKIARFATKDEQKYVYQMLVWHDQILNP